jgi:transaldolase
MLIFLDTTDTAVLRKAAETGLVDGVTTNPTLIAKSGRDMIEVITEICGIISGPVSAEAVANDAATLEKEGRKLAKIADNVTVKLPLTRDGLIACKALSADGIKTNVTLCFSPNQALLAAKAGATFISPFIGRLDDLGFDGMDLIRDIRAVYDNYAFDTNILAASIRTTAHVREAAISGSDCATIPPAVFEAMFKHPLTDQGLEMFAKDWASTGQSIL